MSSMLKKTGGLSFKPKAARRPGAGPAKPPAGSTPATTTTEPPEPSTPALPELRTSTSVADSIETAHEHDKQPVPAEQLPKPAEPQVPSTSTPHTDDSATQSASEPTVSQSLPLPPPITQNPTPPPTNEAVNTPELRSEPHAPAVDLPSGHDAPETLNAEDENESREPTGASLQASTAQPAATLDVPDPGQLLTSGPPTAFSSPAPGSDASDASLRPNEAVVPPPSTSQPPAPKKQAPRRRKSAVSDDMADGDSSAPKKKRQRRAPSSRSSRSANTSEDTSTGAQVPPRRRGPSSVPENPEERTIDHSKMTVGELTKDLGIGKRFKHADEVEKRARDARARYRLKKLDREKVRLGLVPSEEDDSQSRDGLTERGGTLGATMAQIGASMEASAGQGVGYDVVDGQIVVHAASLVVDRHNHDMSNLEEVEENDFTNCKLIPQSPLLALSIAGHYSRRNGLFQATYSCERETIVLLRVSRWMVYVTNCAKIVVNSASFAKRVQTPGNWPEEDTEKFYRLLGMFGTDFETISRLFPGKNRRAIKLKFNKEERLNPHRINATMMVRGQKTVNIDIEEYKASQRQWQAKDKILAEQARLTEEHEREVARLREERRAAGLIDDDESHPITNGNTNSNTSNNGADSAQGPEELQVIEEDADALVSV
ncbi:hypothetical protein F4861DRAFT_156392 [Xylaria intraflava]|nr:hypothetical protein F4861DRAFT_156392 [Xylaria intraflava]